MSNESIASDGVRLRGVSWAGSALGFGLGGFFDGILLHQILQWHHLLSNVEQARQDIRVLILADGLFHLAMYVITGIGLWLLWKERRALSQPGADRRMLAYAALGFAAWHIVDAVLSHWVLGIHRIRVDVDNPLFWDVLWLAIFGVVPLALGWMLLRRGGSGTTKLRSSPAALVVATLVGGPVAALPAPDQSTVLVLFRPDVSPGQALATMLAVDGRLIWADASQQLLVIDLPPGANPLELYAHGALLVSNSIVPVGCFNWTKAA